MNKNPVFQRDFLYEVFTELTQERVFFERNAIPSSSQFHVNEVGYFLAGYFRESLFQFFDYGVYIEADTPLFKARCFIVEYAFCEIGISLGKHFHNLGPHFFLYFFIHVTSCEAATYQYITSNNKCKVYYNLWETGSGAFSSFPFFGQIIKKPPSQ